MADPETIRIVIADDHPALRRGLKVLLETKPDLRVVGEAGDGREAIEQVMRTDPSVVIMDLMMPGIDGVEATKRILARSKHAQVLVLTNYGSDELLFPALEAGAVGFLMKDATGEELVRAVRRVGAGLSSLSPRIARRLVRRVSNDLSRDPSATLTSREVEVLRAMADGGTNDELGDELGISPGTVRTHVTHILSKLNLTRRAQAVAYALKHGLIRRDDA